MGNGESPDISSTGYKESRHKSVFIESSRGIDSGRSLRNWSIVPFPRSDPDSASLTANLDWPIGTIARCATSGSQGLHCVKINLRGFAAQSGFQAGLRFGIPDRLGVFGCFRLFQWNFQCCGYSFAISRIRFRTVADVTPLNLFRRIPKSPCCVGKKESLLLRTHQTE